MFIMQIYSNSVLAQASKPKLSYITSEDFIKPIWHPKDVIINAGDIGRYKFIMDKDVVRLPENVKIRPELIKLLNDLQKEFNTSMIIMSGYRTQVQDTYLWASWLSNNIKCIDSLNEKKLGSWEEWINASQKYAKIYPICTKHQNGDAVDFYWKGLDFKTEKKRDLMIELINEISGTRQYSDDDRAMFGIPKDDNNLLKVVAYMPGESVSILNPDGVCYFHVEYQPSKLPTKPNIDQIGKKMSEQEELELFYKNGESVYIEYDDFLYLARIVNDSSVKDLSVQAFIHYEQVRNKLGNEIPKNLIHARRHKPENGWGTEKVMLEYQQGNEWIPIMDVIEYEDYYLVPDESQGQIKIFLKDVRFPIAKIH